MITTYYAHKITFELTSVERDSSNASIIIKSFTFIKTRRRKACHGLSILQNATLENK